MITRTSELRKYLFEFQCSLGRRLSLADIELLGPIERHRRLGRCSPWIVHDHPDRPGSLPLLRKYLQWVIDYTGVDYPEILFEPPPQAPDSYRGCNFDHIVFTRCRFTLHRDRYDRCTRVFIPQLSPGRLFILHFLCTRPPWVCNETNTSRRERAVPCEEDTRLTLREQRGRPRRKAFLSAPWSFGSFRPAKRTDALLWKHVQDPCYRSGVSCFQTIRMARRLVRVVQIQGDKGEC